MHIIEELTTRPAPVYLVCGGEPLLREEFFKRVHSLLRAAPDFNYDVFYCGQHGAGEIISRLLSYPVGEEFRVVVAREAEKLSSPEQKKILGYLEHPAETSLFFVESAIVPAGAFFKSLAAKGRKLSFGAKHERDLIPWLQDRAGRLGSALSRDAAFELVELSGGNLQILANELEKLSLYAGDGKAITSEEIGVCAGWSRERTGFELGRAISAGKQQDALNILSDILSAGSPPELIIGSLAWQFRTLWKAVLGLRKGLAGGKLAAFCGIPPFRVREYASTARGYTDCRLRSIFSEILLADVKMKTKDNPRFELEIMIVKICGLVPA